MKLSPPLQYIPTQRASLPLQSLVQCCNCDGDMTHDHQCGVLTPAILETGSVGEEHPPPLPLCHYCCHLGSGLNPVHKYLQRLCTDKVCSCKCYCSEEQLEHKKQFFPGGFSTTCVDVNDRTRARVQAFSAQLVFTTGSYLTVLDQRVFPGSLSVT